MCSVLALTLLQAQNEARLTVEAHSVSEMSFATGQRAKKFVSLDGNVQHTAAEITMH